MKLIKKIKYLYLFWCFAIPLVGKAQTNVQTTIPTPNFLYQCADSSMFTVKIKNTTGSIFGSVVVDITQPAGIIKVGTATATKGIFNIVVNDPPANNNNNVLNFSVGGTLAPNDSIIISYWAKALCTTGNLSYTNQVRVTYSAGMTQVNTLAYTVQVPFLELDNAGTATTNVSCANDQFTQVVRVKNDGNFNSFMKFVDIEIIHPASVGIISTTIGTIMVVDGKTVVRLSGNNFTGVGNNDDVLDFDEEIQITVTGRLLDCITTNRIVTFQPLYRCNWTDTAVCRRVPEIITHTLNVNSTDTPPTLTVATGCALNSSASSLQITNGAVASQFVRLTLSIPTACECQAIDFSTLQASINAGAPFAVTPTSTTATGSACLSGNPNHARTVVMNLPNLPANAILNLNWLAPLCGSGACAGASIAWNYSLEYQSTCCPNTIVNLGTGACAVQPQLSAVINPTCVNGQKSLTITNTGNKDATDIAIRLITNAPHLSGILGASVATSGGTLTAGSTTSANVCGNPALLREANYVLNLIPAGQSRTITWNITSCQNFQACTVYNSEDYGFQVSYAQSCATGTLTLNGNRTTQENSLIIDADTELIRTRTCPAENTYTLPLQISGASLTQGQRYAEVVIDLPANLTWNGNVANLLLNGVTAPVSTTVVGNQMTIRYALPIATLPATIAPVFTINCAVVCNGTQSIEYGLNVRNDCAGDNALLHSCNNTQFLNIVSNPNPNCPGPPGLGCVSPIPQPTRTVRTNFGQDDGNNDRFGDADASNQNLRLNKRLMYTDTLQTTYEGTIISTPNSDTLVVNIILYQPQGGNYNHLSFVDLDLTIFDNSANATYTLSNIYACAGVASVRDTLGSRIYTLALTEAALNVCYAGILPANFAFDVNDRVGYNMKHRVSGNLGLNVTRTLQVFTDMYLINLPALWQNPLPIFPGCPNVPADSVQVVGYQYDVTSQQTNGDICQGTVDVTVTHDFNIQATGNLNIFPYENRQWIKFQSIKFTLPTGFTCNPATSLWTYSLPNPPVLPVPPFTQTGNEITFDLTNYYTANNLTVDDGNRLQIRLTLATLCNAQASSVLRADYVYASNLPLQNDLPAQAVFNIATNVPAISYNINSTPVSCTGTKATWSFSVANSNTSAINAASPYYNWLHVEIPPASGFSNVVLLEGVTPIAQDVSGFYLLGNIPKGTTKTYTLTVDYPTAAGGACYNNVLKMFYDWSCTPINTNFTTANFKTGYTCGYDSTQLGFTAGANTVLIDVLNQSYNKVNVCENNTYIARVRNVGQNALRNVKVTVNPPTGFSFVANSFNYTYTPITNQPFTNGSVIIPTFGVGTAFDVSFQYTTTCLDNLAGATQFVLDIDVETCCAGDTLAAFPMPALDVSQIDRGDGNFNIALAHTPELTCTLKNTTLTITLTNRSLVPSGSTDNVVLTLPSGLKYVPNTITTNAGAITDANLTTTATQIYWKMDPGGANPIPVNGTRQYTLQLQDTTAVPICGNFQIRVQTFQQGIAACDALTPSLSCTRWRYTGSRNRRIRVQNNNFTIINFVQTSFYQSIPLQYANARVTFRNNGPNVVLAGSTFDMRVYYDNVLFTTVTVTIPTNIFVGGTFNYDYNNIGCGTCVVKVELPKITANCICTPSEDELWTGFPLGTSLQLNAKLNSQNHAVLEWQTPHQDIAYYTLERSRVGEGFKALAKIQPQTNLTYLDKTLEGGMYQYRLLVHWKQGNITRSNIAELNLPTQENELTVFPNPFESDMHLRFSQSIVGEVSITLADTAGKLVWSWEDEVDTNTLTIPHLRLPKGTYYLRVQHQNQSWTKTLIKTSR